MLQVTVLKNVEYRTIGHFEQTRGFSIIRLMRMRKLLSEHSKESPLPETITNHEKQKLRSPFTPSAETWYSNQVCSCDVATYSVQCVNHKCKIYCTTPHLLLNKSVKACFQVQA